MITHHSWEKQNLYYDQLKVTVWMVSAEWVIFVMNLLSSYHERQETKVTETAQCKLTSVWGEETCGVVSVSWTATSHYVAPLRPAGRQDHWNAAVRPASARTSTIRHRAAGTEPCRTCAGRPCSVWACRQHPTATWTVLFSNRQTHAIMLSPTVVSCCFFFIVRPRHLTQTHNHVGMFCMFFARFIDYVYISCQLCSAVVIVLLSIMLFQLRLVFMWFARTDPEG